MITLLRRLRNAKTLFFSDRATFYNIVGYGRSTPSAKRYLLSDYLAKKYLVKNGLDGVLRKCLPNDSTKPFSLFLSMHKTIDIVNLHKLVTRNRPTNIIEFGCGMSTVAMAHALKQNSERTGVGGKVWAVEASERWATNLRTKLESVQLSKYVDIIVSCPELHLIGSHICHLFKQLPDVRPDMIYLDGPDSPDVAGEVHGITQSGLMFQTAADPLLYEWSYYPGFVMIVDGRYSNVEFLRKNLQRNYSIKRNYKNNVTTFRLLR